MVLTLASRLAAEGLIVTVVSQKNTFLVSEAQRCGLDCISLDFSRRRRMLEVAAALRRLIIDRRPDVVHSHGARAGVPLSLIPPSGDYSRVYTVHGFHFIHKPIVFRQVARWCEKACIERSDAAVFVSRSDQEIARAEGLLHDSTYQEVIYNGIEIGPYREHAVKIFDIGYLGRLHRQKNPLILVEILKAMRPARPTLCVIGGGNLATELERRISADALDVQVTLVGECNRDEALAWLQRCRTVVLPSLWEGLPVSLIEAMQLGIPVVASDIPGNREVVLESKTGYLIPAQDISGYAMRLGKLIEEPALRDEFGEAGRHRAQKQFSVEGYVERHIDLYKRLLAGC